MDHTDEAQRNRITGHVPEWTVEHLDRFRALMLAQLERKLTEEERAEMDALRRQCLAVADRLLGE